MPFEPEAVSHASKLTLSSLSSLGSLPASGSILPSGSVADRILEIAELFPQATAASAGKDRITFSELVTNSRRLASYLIERGARPETPVGICLERSFDFLISILAVVLSGAAYLPLDPTWPAARLNKILEQAQAPLLVSRGSLAADAAGSRTRTIDLDRAAQEIQSCNLLGEPVAVTPETLAYLIYTSGSTGEPKGVEVTHANLLNLISWHQDTFQIKPGDRASHLAGLGFDAAVWEIWPNLTAGATLVLPDEQTRASAALLQDWLLNEHISVAFVPTVLAESLLDRNWPTETPLRYLLTGGEALHRHPTAGLPFTTVNNYGPTECTVVATSGIIESACTDGLPPSIGRPIAATQIRILGSDGRPVPQGQVGEIYIAGAGVARGYRNDPVSTAERFLPYSSESVPGSRMYRTGDLGCFLADGQIVFRGRVDSQEQIRGNRVEPDEVVCALNRHASVVASAVIARGEGAAKKLVAYIVTRDHGAATSSSLREFLSGTLPQYMVPSAFIPLASLPVNSNGKLNRAALPDPEPNRAQDAPSRAPSTPTEEQVLAILRSVLGTDLISPDDNFFLLGLHSLVATQIAARVSDRFGIQLSLRQLFETQTAARLAVEVDRQLIARLESMSDEEVARYLSLSDQDQGDRKISLAS